MGVNILAIYGVTYMAASFNIQVKKVKSRRKMRLKTTPFDVADFLDGPEDIQTYLAEAFALGEVARAHGIG